MIQLAVSCAYKVSSAYIHRPDNAPYLQEKFFRNDNVFLVLDLWPAQNRGGAASICGRGWTVMFFPPNMTHLPSQWILVVNAIVKSAMRRHWIQLMMNYFQSYSRDCDRVQFLILLHHHGVYGMFEMREESMLKDSFKLSVHRVFQSVGLCPIIRFRSNWHLCHLSMPNNPWNRPQGFALSVLSEADETWILRENRTIGGLMVMISWIRWWRLMILRVTVMRTVMRTVTVTSEKGKDDGRCRAV
jgi:hypothetical protein